MPKQLRQTVQDELNEDLYVSQLEKELAVPGDCQFVCHWLARQRRMHECTGDLDRSSLMSKEQSWSRPRTS